MTEAKRKISPAARIAALLITVVLSGLGILAINTGYVSGRWTRFGYAQPLFGTDAKLFGCVLVLLGLLPLLFFAKSARQAALLGTVLFVLLMAFIFGGIYFLR